LSGGFFGDAFSVQTGGPYRSYFFKSSDTAKFKEDLFTRFHEFDKRNLLMTADNINSNPVCIVPQHAYTLIDIKKYTDQYGKTTNLAKMRNPWGSEKYCGPFGDKSKEMDAYA
jgi:hypothetical protein